MASSAARRYAGAILSLAKERGTLNAWQADLARLNELMSDGGVRQFFASPNVPVEQKRGMLDQVLADGQAEARNLAHLLLERRRLDIVPRIFQLYDDGVRAEHGIVVAEVTTARELGSKERLLVAGRLGQLVGKQVELQMHVDPEIIGGIIARMGDLLIDGSVSSQLQRLQTRLRSA